MIRLQTVCLTAIVLLAGGFFVGRMLVAQDRAEGGRRGGFSFRDNAAIAKLDLLKNKDVEKDMKMTDDETSKLQQFVDDMHNQLQAEFQGFRQLSPDDRRAKMSEIQEKLKGREKEINDKLEEVLSSDQRDRLGQIEMQLRMQFIPSRVLLRKEVADNLELTEDQKKKLDEMQPQFGRGGFFGGPGGPGARGNGATGGTGRSGTGRSGTANRQNSTDDQMTKIKEILTPEQNDKLQKMLGPKFDGDLAQVMFGGGGFSGRGRRNRGGNTPPSSGTPSTTTPSTTTPSTTTTPKSADKPADSAPSSK